MTKRIALIAGLASALAFSSANAAFVLIDDFNTPPGSDIVFDTVGGNATGATGAPVATSAGNLATTRTLSHLMITAGANAGNLSSVSVGAGNAPPGAISMNNGSTVDSTATVEWSVPAFVAPVGPVSLFFQVVQSNTGVPPANNLLDFFMNNVFFFQASIPQGTNLALVFGLDAGQIAALAGGGTLKMVANGNPDWDLSLDSFGYTVPEPGSLALLGLGLLGLGTSVRRRKSEA